MARLFLIWLGMLPYFLHGQSPVVPSQFFFADIKLKLTDQVRKEIQEDVNALSNSHKYFRIKVDRADLYMPIIERILKEENVPDDFKYLCIQESALIPDAVSSSNAVGFWQFKKPTGQEVGLRIDSWIDERMNIVAATHGASVYLKNNYSHFDNWLYALLSYNTGLTGSQKWVQQKHFGAKKMELNKHSHWYVKKFLAHKFAYEYAVGKNTNPQLTLVEYTRGANKGLRAIARETSINYEELGNYNLWLRRDPVPADKTYTVILPLRNGRSKDLMASSQSVRPEITMDDNKGSQYPIISGSIESAKPFVVQINGLSGLLAQEDDQLIDLATKGNVGEKQLIKYNDLSQPVSIEPGQVYYLESKRSKGRLFFHTASPGETIWSISQKFGIKLKKLRKLNRMDRSEEVQTGRVLWLRKTRPKDKEIEYRRDLVIPKSTGTETGPQEDMNQAGTPKTRTGNPQASLSQEQEVLPSDSNTSDVITVPTQNDQESTRTHIVKQGETLYSISRQYGYSVEELTAVNKLGEGETIGIGQPLIIPIEDINESRRASKVLFHEVIVGDTLYQIANKYDISVEDLIEWNNKVNHNIQVGEKLVVVSPG